MVSFTSSHYYTIGAGHTYCEDYALATDHPFAIVSDGCSAFPHVDIGSRLVTWEATKQLAALRRFQPESFDRKVHKAIRKTADRIGCHWSALSASMLCAFIRDGTCYIYVHGDGYWWHRHKNGALTITEIDYSSNAPPYVAFTDDYWADLSREYGGQAHIKIRNFSGDDYSDTDFVQNERRFLHEFSLSDTVEFGVATDGFGSFANAFGDDGIEMLHRVLEQPQHSSKEIIVQVTQMLARTPFPHRDDLGIAVIHIEH